MRRRLIAVAIAATLFIAYLFAVRPRPRIFYKQVGITESQRLHSYDESRRRGAGWTRDPSEVGLLLVEGCNHETNAGSDCDNPSRVDVSAQGVERATVIVLDDPIRGDDSIAAEEWRLDLVLAKDGAWDIEWSGVRWRCQRERIDLWTRFSLCS